jgi:hypothetical protein
MRAVRQLPFPIETRPRRSSKPPRSFNELGIVDQVVEACRPRARLATLLGGLLGGFAPVATYALVHRELVGGAPLYAQAPAWLALGGLVFSSRTVFAWGKIAFGEPVKAFGFVVLVEGVMASSHQPALSFAALTLLVAINGIATGCRLSLERSSK